MAGLKISQCGFIKKDREGTRKCGEESKLK